MPATTELPSAVRRSAIKAERTWSNAHHSPAESDGEGDLSHRTAFDAVQHTHEDVGDQWEPRDGECTSHDRAADAAAAAGRAVHAPAASMGEATPATSSSIVAKALEVRSWSGVARQQLAEAIRRMNDSETADAGGRS